MSNSRKFLEQHRLRSPTSLNIRPTFLAPGRHVKAPQYRLNSDGYLQTNDASMNDMMTTFRMKPIILEIANGLDIINCLLQFAQRFGLSITVLSGNGLISEVDVLFPLGAVPPRCVSTSYQLITFSGTYSFLNDASRDIVSCFHVSFADAGGNVMGGRIMSYMKAASIVTLVLSVSKDF